MTTTWISGGEIRGVITEIDPEEDPAIWKARHWAAVENMMAQYPPD